MTEEEKRERRGMEERFRNTDSGDEEKVAGWEDKKGQHSRDTEDSNLFVSQLVLVLQRGPLCSNLRTAQKGGATQRSI